MSKILKVLIIIMVILGIIYIFLHIVMSSIVNKYIPTNLLEKAPNTISSSIKIDSDNPLQKKVTGGVIEGYEIDNSIQVFKGIPYAKPPINDLRWKAPQDVDTWDGVRITKEFGPNPIQGDNEIKSGKLGSESVPDPSVGYSEDCLTLNIWTNGKGTNMPVVFYIPGGAWVGGSSSVPNYNGEYLASQEVIFVSVNYRLGIFGWLGADVLASENEDNSSGNYGLMDLIKALEWVKENISEFGGNPNSITLYGGSAGGNLIDMLMVSPKAEGLFKRAVSMSYPLDMISPRWDKKFKYDLGNKAIPNEKTLDKLRNKSTSEVIKSKNMLGVYAFSGPVEDEVYLPYLFKDGIEKGMSKDVDYIVGINYSEEHPSIEENRKDDSSFLDMIGGKPESATKGDALRIITNATILSRIKGGSTNTYFFNFEHPLSGPTDNGAVHGGDLPFMINIFSELRKDYWKSEDYEMGKIASSYFINFVKTGNPNGDDLVNWEKAVGNYRYFSMNNKCEMKEIKEVNALIEYYEKEKQYMFLK